MTKRQERALRPASDPTLRRAFLSFNRRYFGGELPEDDVTLFWEPPDGAIAKTTCTWERGVLADGEFVIRICPSRRYSKRCWSLDLLHELTHCRLMLKHQTHSCNRKSKRWRGEIDRLAALGAFYDLV